MIGVAAIVAALSVAVVPFPTKGQQPDRDVPLALTRMSLAVRIDYERPVITGTETLHVRNIASRATAEVPLLLNRLMTVASVTDTAGRAIRYRQDVVVFADDSMRQVNAAVVTLPKPVAPGGSIAIVVRYAGRLVGYTETGSLYIRDHIDREFTILREDALAFPVLGIPSRQALRAMPRPPFAFSAAITVPGDLVVATGGRATGATKRDSLTTWMYRSDDPVPFLNIAIAPYRILTQPGVQVFHFPQDSAGAAMLMRSATNAVRQYTQWFGPLSREPNLTVVEIPEGWGSQASLAAGIIQTADAFRDRAQLYQVYHELSHVWNVSDLDRPSPRWNEGLASFLQWRMSAELDGWADWTARLGRIERSIRGKCQSGSPCATVPFADYGKAGLTDLSYQVGAAMFYVLYQTLGADTFDRAYREFFARHRDRGATSADLVAAFTRVSPRSERVFADWFLTTRWFAALEKGESLQQILDGYARP